MSLYLDTSLLISALTHEVDSRRVLDWLDAHNSEFFVSGIFVSDWVVAEFSAALSIKQRMRQIDMTQRAAAQASFARICADSATVLEVTRENFRAAARLAADHVTGLRAGDALHLAICAEHGARLCTLDRRLGEAGPALGVMTLLV